MVASICVAWLRPADKDFSQSKLSQDELNQLQKDTHFDKKELQQWYKGNRKMLSRSIWSPLTHLSKRVPKGLPLRHAHERRVSENLQAILPIWRPYIICRLRFQCLRFGQVGLHRLQRIHMRSERHVKRENGG